MSGTYGSRLREIEYRWVAGSEGEAGLKGDRGSVEMFLVTTDATEEASSEFLCDCYFGVGYSPQ